MNKDTIIVYYSKTGNVKEMAGELAVKRNADIFEIDDLINREGFWGFAKSGYQALRKKSTPIAHINIDLTKYTTAVVCGPIWAGSMTPPIRTFLKDYAGNFKNIEYVIMHADKKKKYKNIFKEMDAITGKKNSGAYSLVQGEKL